MTHIVVGVDGSPHSRRALLRAAAEAKLRGGTVDAVLVYPPVRRSISDDLIGLPLGVAASMGTIDPEDRTQHDLSREREAQVQAEAQLERFVAEVIDETGVVPNRIAIAADHPAEALIDQTASADLLVIGTRGLGGFAGMLLGSVAHQCVQRSHCPLLILPPEED